MTQLAIDYLARKRAARRSYGLPHAAGSETSYDAAQSVRASVAQREAAVEAYYLERGQDGATCDECQRALAWSHQSCSPRVSELARRGVLVDSGRRRPTSSGRSATVYVHRDAVEASK